MNDWQLTDESTGNTKFFDSRAEAEEHKDEMKGLVEGELRIEKISDASNESDGSDGANNAETKETASDGGETATVVQEDPIPPEKQEQTEQALQELGDSIENDPLDVLPSYMITMVDGKPSLNKRGVSVLAYHYGIDVQEHEVVAYPHETDFEAAIVTITVTGSDGRTFTGSGESHVDETPKHQLLRLAETRAYKRAVIFATGTGIVGYQELMENLQ